MTELVCLLTSVKDQIKFAFEIYFESYKNMSCESTVINLFWNGKDSIRWKIFSTKKYSFKIDEVQHQKKDG